MGTHSFTVALGGNSRDNPLGTVPGMLGTIRGSKIVTNVYRDTHPGAGLHYAIWDAANHIFETKPEVQRLIFGEEDIIVGTDVLEYLDWALSHFSADKRVLTACAHNRCGQGWDPHRPAEDEHALAYAVHRDHYFNAWVWATWRDRWEHHLSPHWELGTDRELLRGGYDWNIQNYFMSSGGMYSVFPAASRTQNIGRTRGVYATERTWAFSQAKSFVADRDPVQFRLVS